MVRALSILAVVVAWSCAAADIGPLTGQLRRSITLSCVLVVAFNTLLMSGCWRWPVVRLTAAAIIVGVSSDGIVAYGLLAGLLMLGFQPRGFMAGLLVVNILGDLLVQIGLYGPANEIVRAVHASALGAPLGPSITRLPMTLAIGAGVLFAAGSNGRRAIGIIGLALAYVGHALTVVYELSSVSGYTTLGFVYAAICGLLCAAVMAERFEAEPVRGRMWQAAGFAVAGCLCALPVMSIESDAPRVAFVNEGGLDWRRPRHGDYGLYSSGMFGMLPHYLEMDGLRCEAVTDLRNLERFDVVVFINFSGERSAGELADLDDYVKRGGALLCVGDHTDVFGLMKSCNELLAPMSASFRFDTATPMRSDWQGCLASWPQVLGVAPARHDAIHGLGASLETGRGWRPILASRFAFSDTGNRANPMGAFMGDGSRSADEMLGDLVLAAERRWGSGTVAVYGDTTAFQNGVLPFTYAQHVLPLFRHLAAEPSFWSDVLRVAALLALLAVVAGVSWSRAMPWWVFVASYVVVASVRNCSSDLRVRGAPDMAILDSSAFPLTGHYDLGWNSVGSLRSGLMRSGLRPLEVPMDQVPGWEDAGSVIFVAPGRAFSAAHRDALLAYMERGGSCVVAAGRLGRRAANTLLRAIGLEVSDRRVAMESEGDPEQMIPRFSEPFEIDVLDPSQVVDLVRVGRSRLVVHRKWGAGGCVLVGDDRFFASQNVENQDGHWPGNVALMHHIFSNYCNGMSRTPPEVFASPVMPK